MGGNQEVSVYWICCHQWTARAIKHRFGVGVDVSPIGLDGTIYVMWLLIWIPKGHSLVSVAKRFKGKSLISVSLCVFTVVRSCIFRLLCIWPFVSLCLTSVSTVYSYEWLGLWGHSVLRQWGSKGSGGAHNSQHAIQPAKHVSSSSGTWCTTSVLIFLEAGVF